MYTTSPPSSTRPTETGRERPPLQGRRRQAGRLWHEQAHGPGEHRERPQGNASLDGARGDQEPAGGRGLASGRRLERGVHGDRDAHRKNAVAGHKQPDGGDVQHRERREAADQTVRSILVGLY